LNGKRGGKKGGEKEALPKMRRPSAGSRRKRRGRTLIPYISGGRGKEEKGKVSSSALAEKRGEETKGGRVKRGGGKKRGVLFPHEGGEREKERSLTFSIGKGSRGDFKEEGGRGGNQINKSLFNQKEGKKGGRLIQSFPFYKEEKRLRKSSPRKREKGGKFFYLFPAQERKGEKESLFFFSNGDKTLERRKD